MNKEIWKMGGGICNTEKKDLQWHVMEIGFVRELFPSHVESGFMAS